MAYEFIDEPQGKYEFVDEPKTPFIGRQNPQKLMQTPLLDETTSKGLATAPINAYLGAKQYFGGLSPTDQNVLQQNKEAEKASPVASFVSNAGMIAPSMLIPGSQTVAGAGLVGALQGLFAPISGDQTLENIAKGKAISTGIGLAAGSAGQYAANKVGGFFTKRATDKASEMASAQSKNAVKDATLAEGRAAGYGVPMSEVNPTFLSNRLESMGGKAAIGQEQTLRNQGVTNDLARKAIGLGPDEAISQSALDRLYKQASKPYQEVSAISPNAAADLEAWKAANSEAKGWFTAYNRSGRPDDLVKAKEARETAQNLSNWLDWHAVSSGRNDLIPALQKARVEYAKIGTVERALNQGSGDVSAPVLGRLFSKQSPLSGGLETIGKFENVYPKFMREGVKTQTPGVSKVEALASVAAGLAGAGMTNDPRGAALALLPFASHPARALALSKMMQKAPDYGIGLGTKLLGKVGSEELGFISKTMLPYGLLSAQ